MAENKKSFIAYANWKDIFDELPDEDAGALIKHIFAYVNDENPESDSILIKATFANIKSTLNRDLDKWKVQLKQRSDAGKKSAEIRALKKSNETPTLVDSRRRNPTDSVNDNVNVNENKGKEDIYQFELFWDSYHSITLKAKTDKDASEKYWKKLELSDKIKAFENIQNFYDSYKDKSFCKKARTYLSDKNFNDEFKKADTQLGNDLESYYISQNLHEFYKAYNGKRGYLIKFRNPITRKQMDDINKLCKEPHPIFYKIYEQRLNVNDSLFETFKSLL